MTNFKLQYRPEEPNHWWGGHTPERPEFSALELLSPAVNTDTPIKQYEIDLQLAIAFFKPIAPQDQEKVKDFIYWNSGEKQRGLVPKDWIPNDPSKLYDSGDLEFELKQVISCADRGRPCEQRKRSEWCFEKEKCKSIEQFWTLKEEKQECLHDNTIQISETERGCENCGEVIDSLVDRFFNDKNFWGYINSKEQRLIIAQCAANIAKDEIKQLQNKINSLEEHRENLIAKLMNAEDKLNDLQGKR